RPLHDLLRERSVATYAKALAGLDPPGLRIEAPFEEASIPGILRIPADAARPPLVILVPGLDSVKEELYAIENEFLRRGMATLAVDGPGQGENAPRFPIRADWASVITPLLDHLRSRELGLDPERIGLVGISMGGIYGPRAAAKEKRLRAIVALAGPYDLAECWAGLNALTRDLGLACRVLAGEGQADNIYGHVSGRLPGSQVVWMKGAGVGLDEVREKHLVRLDANGERLDGWARRHEEYPIHTEILRAR